MVLSDACDREDLEIISVNTDYRHKKHLENLSVLKGAKITCLYNRSGDVVIKVKDGRIAINEEFAKNIEVKSLNPDWFTTGKNGKRVMTEEAKAFFKEEDHNCKVQEKLQKAAIKKAKKEFKEEHKHD